MNYFDNRFRNDIIIHPTSPLSLICFTLQKLYESVDKLNGTVPSLYSNNNNQCLLVTAGGMEISTSKQHSEVEDDIPEKRSREPWVSRLDTILPFYSISH